MSNRRELFTSLIGLAALGGPAALPAAARSLDLDDPAANLRAYIKLRGSLDSDAVYDVVRGRVFGLMAGQTARSLFKTVGAQRTRYLRKSSLEYTASSRYVGFLLDWETERLLERWLNPYNGEQCDVPVTRYGPGEMRILTDRLLPAGKEPDEPVRSGRPWFVMGDTIHMLDQIVSPASDASLQPEADLMTFSGSWQQLADPGVPSIPARLSFTAIEPWRDWMHMKQSGSLWWHVAGVKLDGSDEYPDALRTLLQTTDPGFFEPES